MISRCFAAEVQSSRRVISVPGCTGSCWARGSSPLLSSYCAQTHQGGVCKSSWDWSDRQLLPSLHPHGIVPRTVAAAFVSIHLFFSQNHFWIISCFLCSICSVCLYFPVLSCCMLHAFHASAFLGHELSRRFHTAQSGVVIWGHSVFSTVK